MRFFRLFVAALGLAALGLVAAPARAQAVGTITFSPPTWTHRIDGRLINYLNRKDCLDDATASFSYSIQGVSGGTFEVWAGEGCDDIDKRSSSATTKTCARVAVGSTTETRIELPFREMVKTYGSTEDEGVAACDTPQSIGKQTRKLFFVVFDAGTLEPIATSTPASWSFDYDIQAPEPPTNVTAGAGDETLVTSFTPPSGETNLLHYKFYCSLPGSAPVTGTNTAGTSAGGTASTDAAGGADAGGAPDASGAAGSPETTGTAGTTGTTTATPVTLDPGCTSSLLIPGEPPPADAIDCGTIGALTENGGETDPVLTNDTPYVIAIAAEDDANNIGVLSGLACNTPKDVTGFYEAYREAGGQAGGGYCTFAPARRGAVGLGAALLLGACALFRRRR